MTLEVNILLFHRKSKQFVMAQKLEAIGRGLQWDDSSDHDNVTKILVRGGREGIQYVKFDYVKSGQPQTGLIHGLSGRGGFTQTVYMSYKI